MTGVRFPAHKLHCIDNEDKRILLTATGTCIQSLSLNDGKCMSVWPRSDDTDSDDDDDELDGRPVKRLKLEDGQDNFLRRQESEGSEASIEIKTEGRQRQKGERRKPKIPDLTLPHVSHLVTTSDGKHAIAITAEDKAVRVFSVSRKGRLRQLSSRSMPKKSCALTLTADETTILIADKFGDVYALPLHPTAGYQRKSETPQVQTNFKPSATALTVHTKGNLEALRQQQTQKQIPPKKEGLDFEHRLLLGHVSLLTDLAIAQAEIQGKQRPFILTSDRDEHIRVSRGIPQAHIIHTFCLGHTEFVSKLCIIPWAKNVLVAGNGEPSLRVYDWQRGVETQRLDLRETFCRDLETCLPLDRSIGKLAVSGIWPLSYNEKSRGLLVALEGLSLLFVFALTRFELRHVQTLNLDGNALDVVDLREQHAVVVSIDSVHKPCSVKEYRDEDGRDVDPVQIFTLRPEQLHEVEAEIFGVRLERNANLVSFRMDGISIESLSNKREATGYNQDKGHEKMYSVLGEFIYGLENLRKRRGKATDEEEDDDNDEAAGAAEGGLEEAPQTA
ncbi:tRNA (guanine-N(7)-)-methyltransferase non-catalytic subunit trm82 [Neophaeococcomyces mojaviensis]|uniref:tRNA (Guanine-N(7)-)-methyltransferase non-catalytic subunit trm82 n=1 Tax=Neophaeococcomyces mojaviensis TaxID=3383035 RepID=A0ACC3A448_9EURO|nr:tRNA (guanine-N(7)-)-methyltransferase non-catalytic subunit trm82 [Knufia sp. JES_112]